MHSALGLPSPKFNHQLCDHLIGPSAICTGHLEVKWGAELSICHHLVVGRVGQDTPVLKDSGGSQQLLGGQTICNSSSRWDPNSGVRGVWWGNGKLSLISSKEFLTNLAAPLNSGWEVQSSITKFETLLQSWRQIFILENILTCHKTKLHYHNLFTTPKTNVHFRNHINKMQNTFTSTETNWQTQFTGKGHPKFVFGPEAIAGAGQFELLMLSIDRDGERPSHVLNVLWRRREPINVVLFFVWSVSRGFKGHQSDWPTKYVTTVHTVF